MGSTFASTFFFSFLLSESYYMSMYTVISEGINNKWYNPAGHSIYTAGVCNIDILCLKFQGIISGNSWASWNGIERRAIWLRTMCSSGSSWLKIRHRKPYLISRSYTNNQTKLCMESAENRWVLQLQEQMDYSGTHESTISHPLVPLTRRWQRILMPSPNCPISLPLIPVPNCIYFFVTKCISALAHVFIS